MATPEFRETGSTSGQRLFREGQASPAGPPQALRADRFVKRMMGKSPGLNDLARVALGVPPPAAAEGSDLSPGEVVRLFDMLAARPHNLDPEAARSLTHAISSIRGGLSA